MKNNGGQPYEIGPYGIQKRFIENIRINLQTGCWDWQGKLNRDGYGYFTTDRKWWSAHKFFYVYIVGEVTEGLELDHLCRNRKCVNPEHLDPVTHLENVRRGDRVSREFCKNGHHLETVGIYKENGPHGKTKRCAECARIATRKYKENKTRI